jgi:hypothetical protein
MWFLPRASRTPAEINSSLSILGSGLFTSPAESWKAADALSISTAMTVIELGSGPIKASGVIELRGSTANFGWAN